MGSPWRVLRKMFPLPRLPSIPNLGLPSNPLNNLFLFRVRWNSLEPSQAAVAPSSLTCHLYIHRYFPGHIYIYSLSSLSHNLRSKTLGGRALSFYLWILSDSQSLALSGHSLNVAKKNKQKEESLGRIQPVRKCHPWGRASQMPPDALGPLPQRTFVFAESQNDLVQRWHLAGET